MKRYDVHVCMVSQQPLPNLIPIKDEATRPTEVVLLVSEDMRVIASRDSLLLSSCTSNSKALISTNTASSAKTLHRCRNRIGSDIAKGKAKIALQSGAEGLAGEAEEILLLCQSQIGRAHV